MSDNSGQKITANRPRIRAKNAGPESEVAALRRQLYAAAWARIDDLDQSAPLEIITICESIISDRLEALIQRTTGVGKLEHLADAIRHVGRLFPTEKRLLALLTEVDDWRRQRNRFVHQFVKVMDGEFCALDERLLEAIVCSRRGVRLAKSIQLESSKLLRRGAIEKSESTQ